VGAAPASAYAPPKRRADFYERNSFFHCPSASFSKASSPQIAFFSIAMNSQLIEPGRTPTTSISRITRPTQTVLFLDNLLEDEPQVDSAQDRAFLGQPSSTANRFAGMRHGVGGNLAFADGHAEWWQGVKVVETSGINRGLAKLPQTEIVWDPELP
jgi:prepilin-type processing-associated H-X9-DG protein